MGFLDGSEGVRGSCRGLLDRRVKVAPSLLLRSAMSEAVVMVHPLGDCKLAKHNQGGQRVRAKDDAAAALAVAHGLRQPAQPKARWRYQGVA